MLALTTSFSSSFGRPLNFFDVFVVAGGVIPFVISYMILTIEFKVKVQGFRWARRLTHAGLLYLVFAILYILVVGQHTPTTTDPAA
jgi:NADH:ubiquinone oxidoreductase subunit 6 (subunit J)